MGRPLLDLYLQGQRVVVNGKARSYLITDIIKKPCVLRGTICGTTSPVVIKTETEGDSILYEREVKAHKFGCIRNSPHIRQLYEAIDNGTDKCLVFEWMDHDLWSLRHRKLPPNSPFPKILAKSILTALTAFADLDGQGPAVHTDLHPNNIFVSGFDTSSPAVKLADLANLIPSGEEYEYRLQGPQIRAPEIWMGGAPQPPCDVWSVGVSMAHFLSGRMLFGPSDINIQIKSKPLETVQAAWSLAKMSRLVGKLNWDKSSPYTHEMKLAEVLMDRGFIKTGSLEEELEGSNISPECMDFMRHLLTVDPKLRPTAREALEHPWLRKV